MIPLNVSFGIFALLPQGWIFMAFVILIESVLLSKFLSRKWLDKRIAGIVVLSNAISGIIGFIISIILNGGWWLVVWFPWVSDNEVNVSNSESMLWLYIYYACAFVLTVLIEGMINWLLLRKYNTSKQIITATLYVNVISYAIGSIVLYSYSFG